MIGELELIRLLEASRAQSNPQAWIAEQLKLPLEGRPKITWVVVDAAVLRSLGQLVKEPDDTLMFVKPEHAIALGIIR